MLDNRYNSLFYEDEQSFIQSLKIKKILNNNDVKKLNILLLSGETGLSIIQLILNLGLASEADMFNHLSQMNGVAILEPNHYPSKLLGEHSFNTKFLIEQNIVVISETDVLIEICINDPFASGLMSAIIFSIGSRYLKIHLGYKKDIVEALELILKLDDEETLINSFDTSNDDLLEKDILQLKELASGAPVVKIVNSIVKDAIHQNASDIHIEPHNYNLKVRNRVDGVLVHSQEIQMKVAAAIVSRIKILSDLDIAQRRVPQDGRFDISIDGQDVDVRVSVIPTIHGESIVLRLLYKKSMSFDFESLGYSPSNKQKIFQMLDKPHGLILVTGPTGSGKSTTLYAMLQQINNTEKKIISVEDPVEYKIDGINQIRIQPEIGVSFATALRAIVRHDPEVIMVGEMRDSETAEIAIRASMTGHLILTTLHTNSAVASIERLIDLGVEKTFIFSSLVGIVAQRLVRQLCENCKNPITAEHIMLEDLDIDVPVNQILDCYEPVGCDQCNNTGYHGRLSISEVMEVNEDFRNEVILNNANVHQLAIKYGMRPMVVDGFEKVKAGQTTIEELFRVVLE